MQQPALPFTGIRRRGEPKPQGSSYWVSKRVARLGSAFLFVGSVVHRADKPGERAIVLQIKKKFPSGNFSFTLFIAGEFPHDVVSMPNTPVLVSAIAADTELRLAQETLANRPKCAGLLNLFRLGLQQRGEAARMAELLNVTYQLRLDDNPNDPFVQLATAAASAPVMPVRVAGVGQVPPAPMTAPGASQRFAAPAPVVQSSATFSSASVPPAPETFDSEYEESPAIMGSTTDVPVPSPLVCSETDFPIEPKPEKESGQERPQEDQENKLFAMAAAATEAARLENRELDDLTMNPADTEPVAVSQPKVSVGAALPKDDPMSIAPASQEPNALAADADGMRLLTDGDAWIRLVSYLRAHKAAHSLVSPTSRPSRRKAQRARVSHEQQSDMQDEQTSAPEAVPPPQATHQRDTVEPQPRPSDCSGGHDFGIDHKVCALAHRVVSQCKRCGKFAVLELPGFS